MNGPAFSRLAAALGLGLALAGCSAASEPTTEAPAPETPAASQQTVAETRAPIDTGPTTGGPTDGPGGTPAPTETAMVAPIPVDPAWTRDATPRRVYGIAGDDVLHVHAAAGSQEPIVATIQPQATSIQVYDAVVRLGDQIWQPVDVPGGAGWVDTRYLRPMGPPTPQVTGQPTAQLTAAGEQVTNAIEAGDGAALAGLVDPQAGVLVSTDAYLADDDPILTSAQLNAAAQDTTEILWGYTDGEGLPIRQTIAQRLQAIAGSTALTSTTTIGYDARVKTGNTVDNLAERFPRAHVVEYHFPGTKEYAEMDWSSVRLVFDTTDGPRLVAIVQDAWTI